jgi:rhodanese-related sulfurtransferase
MRRKPLFFTTLLLLSSGAAHAIPPPEVVVSLWQSVLQLLGIAAVFVGGALFTVRQFFAQYIVGWKRTLFYTLLLAVIVVLLGWLLLYSSSSYAYVPPESIDTVISKEKDARIRAWKLQTMREMEQEANATRLRKHLPAMSFHALYSEDPNDFAVNLKNLPKHYYVLDVREESERAKFSIPYDASFRYGDLVQGIMPQNLPKDKTIMVLCHSGLRGYLAANFIQQALFKDANKRSVMYLQGGLAEWHVRKLPITGNADYKAKPYPLLKKAMVKQSTARNIQVDADGVEAVKLPNLMRLPYETASTADLQPALQSAKIRPVVLVCKTYSGCFHTGNLAYLIEQQGGKVAGIYDETGTFMRGLQQ